MRAVTAASLSAVALLASALSAQTPLTTARVASGLTKPLWVGNAPGDDRLFVVEQMTADIHIIENGVPKEPPFLDLTPLGKVLTNANERGLLGLAFDPDYQTSGQFFVYYTRQTDGAVVIERYDTIDADNADPNSGLVIFGPIAKPQSNHNGGNVRFGPDGKLYAGLGDGGNANDQGTGHVAGGNAQSGGQMLGKIVRINKDGSVPGDNPFAAPGDGFLDQIWDYGVRNPWRWSFDRQTGDFWLGDVGQDAREEVDFQPANVNGGLNFGWRCMEGFNCTGLSGCTCNDASLTLPIHDYPTNPGPNCAVTGGYVYRGPAIPDLQGTYFFADYCSAQIWSLKYNGAAVSDFTTRTGELAPGLGQSIGTITSFGEDNAGEVYLVDQGGEIFKIVKNPWTNLGGGLPGLLGIPSLTGAGGLLSGTSNQISLLGVPPSVPAQLFMGLVVGAAPFKGGTLIPVPFLIALPLSTSGTGTLDLPFVLPDGVPAGTPLVFQYAVKDSLAIGGVSLSNGLKGTTN